MYEVYIDDMLLPIPPEKIPVKYPGQNKTMNLMNGEEINVIHPPGLAEISLDFIIPQMDYPSAVWDGSFDDAEEFIDRLRDLKAGRRPFEFIVIRESPRGRAFFDTNMDVVLEDYKISDDVKEGFDIVVSVNLKEYRPYGTKIMKFTSLREDEIPEAQVPKEDRPPGEEEKEKDKTYAVQEGDSLWKIAKKKLGDGNRWKEIHDLNRDKVKNPNVIRAGLVLALPQ